MGAGGTTPNANRNARYPTSEEKAKYEKDSEEELRKAAEVLVQGISDDKSEDVQNAVFRSLQEARNKGRQDAEAEAEHTFRASAHGYDDNIGVVVSPRTAQGQHSTAANTAASPQPFEYANGYQAASLFAGVPHFSLNSTANKEFGRPSGHKRKHKSKKRSRRGRSPKSRKNESDSGFPDSDPSGSDDSSDGGRGRGGRRSPPSSNPSSDDDTDPSSDDDTSSDDSMTIKTTTTRKGAVRKFINHTAQENDIHPMHA